PVVPLRQRRSAKPSPLKSRCPTRAQGLPAEPGEPPPVTVVPLISQVTACPLVVLYQRMSLLPSPLKSCVAASGRPRLWTCALSACVAVIRLLAVLSLIG